MLLLPFSHPDRSCPQHEMRKSLTTRRACGSCQRPQNEEGSHSLCWQRYIFSLPKNIHEKYSDLELTTQRFCENTESSGVSWSGIKQRRRISMNTPGCYFILFYFSPVFLQNPACAVQRGQDKTEQTTEVTSLILREAALQTENLR